MVREEKDYIEVVGRPLNVTVKFRRLKSSLLIRLVSMDARAVIWKAPTLGLPRRLLGFEQNRLEGHG
jgi:hypothetical protein